MMTPWNISSLFCTWGGWRSWWANVPGLLLHSPHRLFYLSLGRRCIHSWFCTLEFSSSIGHLDPLSVVFGRTLVWILPVLSLDHLWSWVISLLLSFRHFCVIPKSWCLRVRLEFRTCCWMLSRAPTSGWYLSTSCPGGVSFWISQDTVSYYVEHKWQTCCTTSDDKHLRLCGPSILCKAILYCHRQCMCTWVGTPPVNSIF